MKSKERNARYRRGEKSKAAKARFMNSEKGKTLSARRIFIGRTCRGLAQTIEQAAMIRHHIKERTLEFISRQQARA